jgi:hypothetical protein
MHTKQTIQTILQKIRTSQRHDGAIPGSSAAIFGTALVATILSELASEYASAETICSASAAYLIAQTNTDGSCAYWEHGSIEEELYPYPPDLDDTALAAAARINTASYDGEFLAQTIHLLTTFEAAEGGPYNTWCTHDSAWKDIDIGVNANIAYFLSLLSIDLPNLHRLFDEAIASDTYRSRYYHSPLMLLFLISRAYKGTHADKAIASIKHLQHPNGTWDTYANTALALCTLSNFGEDISACSAALSLLCTNAVPSDPLYRERIVDGEAVFYTNPSVSRALAARAFHRSIQEQKAAEATHDIHELSITERWIKRCAEASPLFADLAQRYAQALLSEPISKDAVKMPFIFASLVDTEIPHTTIDALAEAHLFGWIGYKILDGVMDNEQNIGSLPFATFCIRSFTATYRRLFPDESFQFFSEVMNNTEHAFALEHASTLVHTGKGFLIHLDTLVPITWEKSLGHALPILAVMILAGHDRDSAAFKSTKQFYTAFLHARQLNDDAHDIIEDLSMGRVSIPGKHILERFVSLYPDRNTYSIPEDEETIRRIFWHDCFPLIHHEIEQSLSEATEALNAMPIADKSYCASLLSGIAAANKRAATERERMLAFLKSYEASPRA